MSQVDEIEVMCPYDKAHRILRSRLQYHLVKCSKNHNLAEYAFCPYDSSHRVVRIQLQDHIKNECSAAPRFEKDLFVLNPSVDLPLVPPPSVPIHTPESSENWDDDDEFHASYNPLEHAAKKATYRTLRVEPPAKRKEFKLQNRVSVTESEVEEDLVGPLQKLQSHVPSDDEPLRIPQSHSESFRRLEKASKVKESEARVRLVTGVARGVRLPSQARSVESQPGAAGAGAVAAGAGAGADASQIPGMTQNWLGVGRGRAQHQPSPASSSSLKTGAIVGRSKPSANLLRRPGQP